MHCKRRRVSKIFDMHLKETCFFLHFSYHFFLPELQADLWRECCPVLGMHLRHALHVQFVPPPALGVAVSGSCYALARLSACISMHD